ncbi:hypothetical protein [Micromonospora sp. NPDC000442]|uniref:hypothetical protein n=1 Tax=Micromonospora sp. NPDC000442 TaxID=3364217 RepID=UPI003677B1FF
MTRRFGDRATFAVEIGAMSPPALRVVDVWAADRRLTTDDNMVYVPSFSAYMWSDADRVRRRDVSPCPFHDRAPEEIFHLLHGNETGLREHFWFLQWSETLDNVSAYAYLDDELVILFQFWRARHPLPDDLGKVLVATIPPDEFVAIVREAVDLLDAGSSAGDLHKDSYP